MKFFPCFWFCLTPLPSNWPQEEKLETRLIESRKNEIINAKLISNRTREDAVIGTAQLNILVEAPDRIKSVSIESDGPFRRVCESLRPFTLFPTTADTSRNDTDRFAIGSRTVRVITFEEEGCKGVPGKAVKYQFEVLGKNSSTRLVGGPSPFPGTNVSLPPSILAGNTEAALTSATAKDLDPFQPKISTVEHMPARKVAGILDLNTDGTPWCRGAPTYWTPGHKADNDTPYCLINGIWIRPFLAQLDDNDDLNDRDGPAVIDRHDCGVLDVDNDGIVDLYCLVGANSGRGAGYNELYLTNPDGSLRKVRTHGLQKYNGMRGRYTSTISGKNGTQFIFIATKGVVRRDGKANEHRMFRKTGVAPDYFVEEFGDWIRHTNASFVKSVDINRDGIDDVLVGNRADFPLVYLQKSSSNGSTYWENVLWNKSKRQKNWRSVRIADFTGDGITDLLVVYYGYQPSLRIYRGIRGAPFFDFEGPVYDTALPYGAPDVEVIDVNGDGIIDFYVVQSDESPFDSKGNQRSNTYCAGNFSHRQWWSQGNQPPPEFVPPADNANDILFVGKVSPNSNTNLIYEKVFMDHAEPGCGNLVRPFGQKQLLLTQGNFVRPGYQLTLAWD